jgi:hypothetical protein
MLPSLRYSTLLLLCSLSSLGALAQGGASSPLLLQTSDPALQQTFDWAKTQALAYVGSGNDPVGDWYEAALPGRNSFCMRDVSHQTMGAYALGLASHNHNMLRKFAQNISASKDWASYWEIDRQGRPSRDDYQSDEDFWYNLPANFDVMSAALRMYRWTGDTTYIDDPVFANFYKHTVSDYPKRWHLEPPSALVRDRIMNQRTPTGRFVEARGIPSYTEGQKDFVLGVDVLAAEYRALRFAADLAHSKNHLDEARKYDLQAMTVQRFLETKAWNPEKHHFYGFARNGQDLFGDGDAFVLYFSATKDPAEIKGALSAIEKRLQTSTPGIEEQSYLPEILYRYGASEEAYSQILDLSRPNRERREYPEVSYSIIGAIVTGLMGIDVASSLQRTDGRAPAGQTVISTRPQLSGKTQWVELDHLPVRTNVINLRHDGSEMSSLTNVSGPALLWQPRFSGHFDYLMVNGHRVAAIATTDDQHHPMTTTSVLVKPKSQMVVSKIASRAAPDSMAH